MKDNTKIYNYFTTNIEPKFKESRSARNRQRFGSLLLVLAFLAAFVLPFVWAGIDIYTGSFNIDEVLVRSIKIFFIGFPSLLVIFFLLVINEKILIRAYQKKVVAPLLREWDPTLVYVPTNGVSRQELLDSRFIRLRTFSLTSSNLIYLKERDSCVKLAYARVTHPSRGEGAGRTGFEGLFGVVENSLQTDGIICILSTAAQQHFSYLTGSSLPNHHKELKKISMNDSSFDKHYAVYTDNATASRRVLTRDVMKRLTLLSRQGGLGVFMTFVDKKIYIGLEAKEQGLPFRFFHPDYVNLLNREGYTFDLIEKSFDQLIAVQNIIGLPQKK